METKKPPYPVLLLDDDEDDYVLIKKLLHDAFDDKIKLDWYQQDGFSTIMICSNRYILTLVDHPLGMENGLEVIRKAKAECNEAIIYLVTAWPDPTIKEAAEQAGANGLLHKQELSVKTVRSELEHFFPLV